MTRFYASDKNDDITKELETKVSIGYVHDRATCHERRRQIYLPHEVKWI